MLVGFTFVSKPSLNFVAGVVVGRTNTFHKLTDMTTKRKEEVDGSVNKSSSKPSKFPDKTESGSQAKVASKSRPIAKVNSGVKRDNCS